MGDRVVYARGVFVRLDAACPRATVLEKMGAGGRL